MLLLIVALVAGVLLINRNLRLEGVSEAKPMKQDIRAYVDGKPVKSYLKE